MRTTTILMLCLLWSLLLPAQDDEADINLPFASTYGIGEYEIEGRVVQVYRIPFSVPLKRQAPDERWGLRLTLPVSLGFFRVTESEDLGDLVQRFETMAVTPGFELAVDLTEAVDLRPFAEIGMGTQIDGVANERLFSAGLRGGWNLTVSSLKLRVGAAFKYNHTSADYAFSNSFTTIELGSDLMLPWSLQLDEHALNLSLVGITRRFNGLEFDGGELGIIAVEQEHELGFMLGADPPYTLWGMKLPRIGLSYRWSQGINGVRLNFGFPL